MINESNKYGTILLDPPWDIQQKGKNSRGAERHYNLMSLEQIKGLPISDLAEENAHVWLWVTNASMEFGYSLLRHWGFIPRSIFTWIKPRMGLGVYLRNASESCLLGTRGKAPIRFKAQMNWGFFPLQKHSHKPEELYSVIFRCSPGPYLEMFARRKHPNFDSWGDEIESDVIIDGYPVPLYSAKAIQKSTEGAA